MYLITASFLCVCVCGRGIISNKAATCFPFLIGCPIEVKKPVSRTFQNRVPHQTHSDCWYKCLLLFLWLVGRFSLKLLSSAFWAEWISSDGHFQGQRPVKLLHSQPGISLGSFKVEPSVNKTSSASQPVWFPGGHCEEWGADQSHSHLLFLLFPPEAKWLDSTCYNTARLC